MESSTHDLKEISHFLDSKFRGPFGWRFGWDGILGLIPGLGDVVTSLFSFYIIVRSAQMGCPPSVLSRMGLNVLVDNVFDAIPIIGNVFDFVWKSNLKNTRLLEEYLQNPRRTTVSSRLAVMFALIMILGLMIGCLVLAFLVLRSIWGFLQQAW